MSLGDPHGLWSAILYWGLLATFMLAAAIPHRRAADAGAVAPARVAADPGPRTTT
jgi:hypothetical protein